jgi:hypothetical protein
MNRIPMFIALSVVWGRRGVVGPRSREEDVPYARHRTKDDGGMRGQGKSRGMENEYCHFG